MTSAAEHPTFDSLFSGEWTPEERLLLIAQVAAFISSRAMHGLPYGELGTPNAESIRAIAQEPAEVLEQAWPQLERFWDRCARGVLEADQALVV